MECIHMPWSQLTRITIWDFAHPAQDCLDILAQCTNALFSAVFTKVIPWAEPSSIDRIVHLACLERLRIIFARDPYNHYITPFFTALSLPALSDLSIQARGIDWSPSDFTDFQHRSPNIRELHISGAVRASEHVIRILSESPHLVSLSVEGLHSSINPLLQVLQFSETAVHVAASLERLSLQEFHGTVNESILSEMILSRWWTDEELRDLLDDHDPSPVRCWKALEIVGAHVQSYTKSFKGMVKLLRTEGLEVTLSH
ncbi:hypothetical protein FB45DRAFT_947974 [Roridomyces roridus]|uniref:Uncharacterized protein n=1 Tax=Roridomyces roridus TaxID=1738132 RepID=A0AAD7B207_9AGAR|nr:hypothetical protein FB45DRAFT_947974 [Roridomyces roridus]